MRITDAITLRRLLGEARRVLCQILHLVTGPVAGCQARVFLAALGTVSWWVSQHFRLAQLDTKVRRDFTHVGTLSLVESVEKISIAAVVLVERPSLDRDTFGRGLVDQIQRDLLLGFENNIIGNVVFLRRAGSSAHSLGKYNRVLSRQLNVSVA